MKNSDSLRVKKYVKARVRGKNKTQAGIEAGYTKYTARNAAQNIESKPQAQKLFKDILEKVGISDMSIARGIKEGLSAKETKFFQKDGKVTATRTVVNHAERRANREVVLKLKGHLIDKHEIIGKLTLAELVAGSWDEQETD